MLNNVENYRSDNFIKCVVMAYLVHQNINIPKRIEATKQINEIGLNQDGKLENNELINPKYSQWIIKCQL